MVGLTTKTRLLWQAGLACALAVPVALVGLDSPASASPTVGGSGSTQTVDHVALTLKSPDGSQGSLLTLDFDHPQPKASVDQLLASVAPDASASVGAAVSAAAGTGQGPKGAALSCNRAYSFADPDGVYSIQHRCGGSTAPWGYQISPGLCAIIISAVGEHGMSWARNGSGMPRQAPHSAQCTYHWHGTFNPATDNNHIAYVDLFEFQIRGGHGTLQIYGDFTLIPAPCRKIC